MKKRYLTILSVLIITIISACGPAPAPTLTAEEISNTAIADAWIAITLTQAAMPTATATVTPLPPTQTPLPTVTLLPTLPVVATTDLSVPTLDPCNQPPPVKPIGATVQVQFLNKSEGIVNLSFGMMNPNAQKECATYSYTLGIYDTPVVTVLAGCYWGYAWITGKEPSVARTGDTILCVTDPGKIPQIWITKERIYFH